MIEILMPIGRVKAVRLVGAFLLKNHRHAAGSYVVFLPYGRVVLTRAEIERQFTILKDDG